MKRKATITQSELEDVAKTIFEETPKEPEFVTFETFFGTISFLKDNLKPQHE
jgi:hypothetical protein